MNTETRFHIFRTCFSISGNPILGDGQSAAYRMYMAAVVITLYGCCMGEIIETLRNLENFEQMFECAKVSIPVTASCCVDLFMRYKYLLHIYSKILMNIVSYIFFKCIYFQSSNISAKFMYNPKFADLFH
jgi:hypothetical protein